MSWTDWRAKRKRDAHNRAIMAAVAQATAELPPITPEMIAEDAGHRACADALVSWARSATRCPACGAETPPPEPPPADAAAPVATPRGAAPVPVPVPAGSVRVDGALRKQASRGTRGTMRGRHPFQLHGFSSSEHAIECQACRWRMVVHELHGGPPPLGPAPGSTSDAGGPRRRWQVRDHAGAVIGAVTSGGGQPTRAEAIPDASAAQRVTMCFAEVLTRTVHQLELAALGAEAADALRLRIVQEQLARHGGTIEPVPADRLL